MPKLASFHGVPAVAHARQFRTCRNRDGRCATTELRITLDAVYCRGPEIHSYFRYGFASAPRMAGSQNIHVDESSERSLEIDCVLQVLACESSTPEATDCHSEAAP